MNNDKIFINELFRIINGALRLDIDKVRNYASFLADKLEKTGDEASAVRLRKLLNDNDRQLRPAATTFAQALPVDTESRFPLVERIDTRTISEPPVILNQDQWDTIREFVSVAKSYGQAEIPGSLDTLSLLLYGPPGTGKSRLARHIACELELDLFVARLDGLISSYLGSTSKNIRALFDFAAKTPCVLFLDEFDAIAKLRGDSQELGELKRVVNSFIQNLDALGNQSIVLAATNHHELLDSAIWRRFSYRLALDYPSPELRRHMWSEFSVPLGFTERYFEVLIDLSAGFSGSDIREVCTRLQRRHLMSGQRPCLKDAFQVLRNIAIGEGEERRFLSGLRGRSEPEIVVALRERDPKLYSSSVLAELLDVSKATAYRWAKGSESDA